MKDFTFETEITINGVDCEANVFIEVTKYVNQPGNFLCRDSEEDFFGYKEVEYNIKCVDTYIEGDLIGEFYTEAEIDSLGLDSEEIEDFLFKKLA